MRLQDKIAVITGGAGGIGRCAVRAFAREGATVLIFDVDEQAGAAAAAEVVSAGGKAQFYRVDISRFAEVQNAFAQIESAFGGVDILYNNASVFWGKRDAALDVLDMDMFERIVKINLFGLVYCSKCAIPLMK